MRRPRPARADDDLPRQAAGRARGGSRAIPRLRSSPRARGGPGRARLRDHSLHSERFGHARAGGRSERARLHGQRERRANPARSAARPGPGIAPRPDLLVASGRICATYRGSIDLFDHLREPLIEHVEPGRSPRPVLRGPAGRDSGGPTGMPRHGGGALAPVPHPARAPVLRGRRAAAVLARRARGRAARPCHRPHAGAARTVVQPAATRRGRRHEPFGLRRPVRRGLEPISDRVSEGTSARPGRPAPHAHRLAGEGRRRPSRATRARAPSRAHSWPATGLGPWRFEPHPASRPRGRALSMEGASERPPWQAIAR